MSILAILIGINHCYTAPLTAYQMAKGKLKFSGSYGTKLLAPWISAAAFASFLLSSSADSSCSSLSKAAVANASSFDATKFLHL